jgi:hypothetical protein
LLYKTFAVLRYRSISYQSRKRIFLERTEVRKVLAVDFSEARASRLRALRYLGWIDDNHTWRIIRLGHIWFAC